MTKTTVKCNFEQVFAQFTDKKELVEVANNLCAQIKAAYTKRAAEIAALAKGVELTVEVETAPATAKEKTVKKATEKKTVKTETKAKAKTAKKTSDDDVLIAITDKDAIKKLGLKFEKYTDKSWVLYGNTKPLRKALLELGGCFHTNLKQGDNPIGWTFRTEDAAKCAKALGLKVKIA